MANEQTGVKISLLPAASTPGANDLIPGVQGQSTVKFYLSSLAAYINGLIGPDDIGAVPNTRKVNGKALTADITIVQAGSISLSGTWSGAGPYSQTVTVTGATVTESSKVDLQLTASQIAALISAGVTALVIENDGGTLTAWAVGAATGAMTVQCTVTEVTA